MTLLEIGLIVAVVGSILVIASLVWACKSDWR